LESDFYSSSRFKYEELPQDISQAVYNLKPNEISKPFVLKTDRGSEEVVIVKVKNRIEGHRANMNSDFQTIKALALNKKKESVVDAWILKKQKETYIHIEPAYRNCEFRYPGWLEK
ncbi:peptidylprolyl isomerase, partial [Porphyromonas loveana]